MLKVRLDLFVWPKNYIRMEGSLTNDPKKYDDHCISNKFLCAFSHPQKKCIGTLTGNNIEQLSCRHNLHILPHINFVQKKIYIIGVSTSITMIDW